MSKDIHYLGEFNSISDVWELYPNGGGYGDYITIGGQTIYWIEETRSWGPKTDTGGSGTPSETIPHSIDVKGEGKFRDGITVGEYVPETTGGAIDKHGNADFRTAKIESLFVKHDGELIPLSEYIKLFKTELPPDWEEYANAPLFNSMRLLVFDPNSGEKYYTTVKSIKDIILADVEYEGGTGGTIQLIRSDDTSTTPTDNNAMSSLRTLLEIQNHVSEQAHEIIKSLDTQTEPTDENVFSSLRTLLEIGESYEDVLEEISRKYLRKDIEDTAFEKITFLKGIIASDLSTFTDLIASGKIIAENIDVKNHLLTNTLKVILQADLQTILLRGQMNSETFASGFLGHGMRLRKNGDDWELELDNIIVRKSMTVYELIVQEMRYQAGQHIYSPAGAKLTEVIDYGSHWRCEHDGTMDFITGAQVLCQRFEVGSKAENPDGLQTYKDARIKRYWRLVTSYGSGWFNLSKTDCESGSDFPEIDDQVAVLGHRTNPDWQNAIMLVSTGSDAPYLAYYAGINSYSTVGKEVIREGNLNGIVDAQFGQLRGHGLYAENVYLKGQFRLNNSKLIEDAINDAYKQEHIGALNLLREYDARFGFKYWGETGEKVEVDFNTINPYKVMILCDRDNVIVTEDNLAIKIIL